MAMNQTLKKIGQISGISLLALLVLVAAFGGVAYALYYSPQAANLPCRGCDGAAQAVTIDGFDLYYRAIGRDQGRSPIVLLHGGPGQSSQTLKDGFDFLADNYRANYRVIFYDQRGSGNSQIKPGAPFYTIEQLVAELETLRHDVIRTEKMILIGHSAGGALAMRYAMLYPEHVEKMVLVCALAPNNGLEVGGPLMHAIYAALNVVTGNLPPADPRQADLEFNELLFKTNIGRLYDPRRTDLLQDMGYVSFAVNRDITSSTMGGNFDQQLGQLTFPSLIIYGKADHSPFTDEAVAKHFQAVLPNATLMPMEHSGHWPYLEEHTVFQTVLLSFLGSDQHHSQQVTRSPSGGEQ